MVVIPLRFDAALQNLRSPEFVLWCLLVLVPFDRLG